MSARKLSDDSAQRRHTAEPKAPGSGFGTGLASLVAALNTDFNWLREHTRYLQRATEWDAGGRPTNRLLAGNDILEAKAWAARRPKSAPEPTALHLDFIRASEEEGEARLSAERKQLEAMAAAQAEREKALHEAEAALKQAADAQRNRARIRNIALVVVSILAVVAGWLGWRSRQQRQQADGILASATNLIVKLQTQMDIETKNEAFAVLQRGADHGDMTSMLNLGLSFQTGFGVAQHYAKAREWFEKAAAKGDARAMTSLGALYEHGHGVAQDYAKAREWFEKAAAKGDARAMTRPRRANGPRRPAAEAEQKRRAAEAAAEQQIALLRAEQERQARAAAEAEQKRRAAEAERQRLLALVERERQAAEAAKRKADEATRQ